MLYVLSTKGKICHVFLLFSALLLGKAIKYYVQCFLVKCFSGVLKVQTKFGLQKHRWVWVAKTLSNMAAEWFLQPNQYLFHLFYIALLLTIKNGISQWVLHVQFAGTQKIMVDKAARMISHFLPSEGSQTKGATSETVTPESAKWKTLKTIRCQRMVWDCFCISLKTNRTRVTQELYLDEKTMPHVYVIVSRIYGSYTRSYILMTMPHVYVIVSSIWARWEKSIENKISKRYCRVVQTYCLGRAPTSFHVAECQSFVVVWTRRPYDNLF